MNDSSTSPQDVLTLIEHAIESLRRHRDRQARTATTDLQAIARSMDTLAMWLDALRRNDPWMLAAIVGEFNAGKSSLVNAMLGTQAAFTDPFEATSTTAVYINDDAPPYVDLLRDDGSTKRLSISHFMDACRTKTLECITCAEVHVKHGLPYRLADTCGLGTITSRNERLAEQTITQADVLVWVVDSNDIGSNQEAAFVRRCRTTGMPLLVALGKSDLFSKDELRQAIGELCARMQMKADQIIPISPLNHTPESKDVGVVTILDQLARFSGDLGTTRKRSHRAKKAEACEEALRSLPHVSAMLSAQLASVEAERTILDVQAKKVVLAVVATCHSDMAKQIRAHLQAEFQGTLTSDQAHALYADAAQRINQAIADRDTQLWQQIVIEVRDTWDRELDEQQAGLHDQLASLSRQPSGHEETIAQLRARLEEVATRQTTIRRSTASEASAWIIGAAVVVYAFLTGDTRPISQYMGWLHGRRIDDTEVSEQVTLYQAKQCIDVICGEYLAERVNQDVAPRIQSLVDGVVVRAIEEFCVRRAGCSVQQLKEAASDVQEQIECLKRSVNV